MAREKILRARKKLNYFYYLLRRYLFSVVLPQRRTEPKYINIYILFLLDIID